jgi:hypothetical protein
MKRGILKSLALALWRSTRGLSFSDRLNVGLFVLTVVTTVIALWSVHISIVTLHEARDGGQKQQVALDASKESLNSAKESLNSVKDSMTSANASLSSTKDSMNLAKDSLDSSVRLLKHQDAIQQQTLENIRDEVRLLQSINAQPNARGFLTLSLNCGDDVNPKQELRGLVGETENRKFSHSGLRSSARLLLLGGNNYGLGCAGQILNPGNRAIDSYELSLFFDPLIGTGFPDSSELRQSRSIEVRDGREMEVHGTTSSDWGTLKSGDAPITIRSGGRILPVSQDPDGAYFRFRIRVPVETKPGSDHRVTKFYGTLKLRIAPAGVDYDTISIDLYRLPSMK